MSTCPRILLLVVTILLAATLLPATALAKETGLAPGSANMAAQAASDHTADDAINWAKARLDNMSALMTVRATINASSSFRRTMNTLELQSRMVMDAITPRTRSLLVGREPPAASRKRATYSFMAFMALRQMGTLPSMSRTIRCTTRMGVSGALR